MAEKVGDLGDFYKEQGQYTDAELLYQRALMEILDIDDLLGGV